MAKKIKGFSLKNGSGVDYTTGNVQLLERIGRILMTNQGERVNNFNFGSQLSSYLFLLPNVLLQRIELEIRSRIAMYEPGVVVNDVDIEIGGDIANIKIYLTKRDTFEQLTLEAALSL